jgi:hypothetical protein
VYRKGHRSHNLYRYREWLVQLPYSLIEILQGTVCLYYNRNRQKTATCTGDCLSDHWWREAGWPAAGGRATAVQWRLWNPTCLCSFSITATDYVMWCHVMSHYIIPYQSLCHITYHMRPLYLLCVMSHCPWWGRNHYRFVVVVVLLLLTDYFTECYCRRLSKVSKAPAHPSSGYF